MIPRQAITKAGLTFFYVLFGANWFTTYHYDVNTIRGPSMAPFLSPDFQETGSKDWVLFKKSVRLSDRYAEEGEKPIPSELKRGMIVSFLNPTSNQVAVKRVIALGGDKIKPLPRDKLSASAKKQGYAVIDHEEEVTVPFGHVWVEGDQVDSEKNFDSNSYGPISKSLIRGVATRILLPLNRSGKLDWDKDWEKRREGRMIRAKDDHFLPQDWLMHW